MSNCDNHNTENNKEPRQNSGCEHCSCRPYCDKNCIADLITTKKLDEIIEKALNANIIELGTTSDGPVGFVINGLESETIDADISDKSNALCINAIWYASDILSEDDEDDDHEKTDDELSVQEIKAKYGNDEIATMIVETIDSMDDDVAVELVDYLVSVIEEQN